MYSLLDQAVNIYPITSTKHNNIYEEQRDKNYIYINKNKKKKEVLKYEKRRDATERLKLMI